MTDKNLGFTRDVTNTFGEVESLWLRINDISIPMHDDISCIRIRGYASEEAFKSGGLYKYESLHKFKVNYNLDIMQQISENLDIIYAAKD